METNPEDKKEVQPPEVIPGTEPTPKDWEKEYKELEQRHKSLQGMFKPKGEENPELLQMVARLLEMQEETAEQLAEAKTNVDFLRDLSEQANPEWETKRNRTSDVPKVTSTRRQNRQVAEEMITGAGFLLDDPEFMVSLAAANPVKAVQQKITQKSKKNEGTDELRAELAELKIGFEEKVKEAVNKQVHELQENLGLLRSPKLGPGGVNLPDAEFMKEFSEGKRNSPDDFQKAQKILGNMRG